MATKQEPSSPLVNAYQQMMSRVHQAMAHTDKANAPHPPLQHYLDEAIEKTVALGELSREQAEQIGRYLQRDLQDAATHWVETESELASWLRFDLQLIEQQVWEMFASVADKTRLELLQLEDRAQLDNCYQTGEITGPGALQCTECGVPIYFHATAAIPACPACGHTEFTRVLD